jgi:hypothetical protein
MGALTLIVGAVSLVPATLAVVLRSRVPFALTGCLAHAAAVGLAVAACSSDSLSPYTTWLLQVSGLKTLLQPRVTGWLSSIVDSPAAAAAVGLTNALASCDASFTPFTACCQHDCRSAQMVTLALCLGFCFGRTMRDCAASCGCSAARARSRCMTKSPSSCECPGHDANRSGQLQSSSAGQSCVSSDHACTGRTAVSCPDVWPVYTHLSRAVLLSTRL